MEPRDRLKEIERLRTEGVLTPARYHEERSNLIDELVASRWLSWRATGVGFGAGCLTLILIPIIIVGALIATDTDDESAFPDDPDIHVDLADGSAATIPSWDESDNLVTLLEVADPAPVDPTSLPRPGYRFVHVKARIERSGNGDGFGIGGDFATSFQIGAENVNTAATGVIENEIDLTNASSIDVDLTFEVRDDADIEWLRYNPNSFAGSIYFDDSAQ